MATCIALLRGINVSGHNMIKMDDLKRVLGELDFKEVRTYIQSGNIVFNSEKNDVAGLAADISGKIRQHFGFDVPVVIRTVNELELIIKNNPFLPDGNKEADKMHVTFLADIPDAGRASNIMDNKFLPDEFVIIGKEIYLYCPDGYGRTKLTPQFFESRLKVATTTRNWRTVEKLLTL
jgi:uncharacterized protein (DUF1697 family)